ncbi:Flp family type IVb pilin [Sphingobium aquiterrae]|uniref:Flp family type IVb pilin n=1 Tax=Sphingobium aquiterrae TaxID=2038656 RepID=UPI0030177CAE
MNIIKTLWNDESGASAAEYALILAIVGTGIAGAAWYLGDNIKTAMTASADCIKDSAAATSQAAATAACQP